MKKINTKIPAFFQKLEDIDDRFMRVKIWLMHLGENYNGSSFEKENVIKAIPTLANTPILGFIEDNGDNEDFSDHRMVLTIKDGEFGTKYLGQAYGTIPEDNNARFEVRVGDDGVAREYLTCEGLLWQKWDIPTEIMDRDLVKSQSMELHEKYEGYWNDKTGLFHFTNFKFFGACILGSSVMPGMNSATIEKEFSQSSFQLDLQEKMEEFKIAFSRYQESIKDDTNKTSKEDKIVHDKFIEFLAKYSLSEDMEQVKALVLTDFATEEDLDAKLASIAQELTPDPDPTPVVVDEPVVVNEFEVEINTLKSELEEVKLNLQQAEDSISTLKTEKETISNELATANTELFELRTFKASKETEERQVAEDALYETFSTQLSKEDIDLVKDEASGLTLDEVEFKLFALVGKKNFQLKKDDLKGNAKMIFTKSKDENEDDGYGNLLTNYIKSN